MDCEPTQKVLRLVARTDAARCAPRQSPIHGEESFNSNGKETGVTAEKNFRSLRVQKSWKPAPRNFPNFAPQGTEIGTTVWCLASPTRALSGAAAPSGHSATATRARLNPIARVPAPKYAALHGIYNLTESLLILRRRPEDYAHVRYGAFRCRAPGFRRGHSLPGPCPLTPTARLLA
jgi:hypothetical protein